MLFVFPCVCFVGTLGSHYVSFCYFSFCYQHLKPSSDIFSMLYALSRAGSRCFMSRGQAKAFPLARCERSEGDVQVFQAYTVLDC